MDPRDYGDNLHKTGCPFDHTGDVITVVGHPEVVALAHDTQRVSSAVSAHLQLPNGLDGEEHTRVRGLVDSYLDDSAVAPYYPAFLDAARSVLDELDTAAADIDTLGQWFAVRAMRAWLGWPAHLEQRLVTWVDSNAEAKRSGQPARNAQVAAEFDAIIGEALAHAPAGSITQHLANNHGLRREEIVSILRNWTAGDLGSVARCIGVVAVCLANDTALQDRVRAGLSGASHTEPGEFFAEFVAIVDEALRRDDPFVSNRRITTAPVTVGGYDIAEGQRLYLHWTAANRDPRVFGDGFDPIAHADANLVWGTGTHACPGKYLSMVELAAFFAQLLSAHELVSDDAVGERDGAGGWKRSPVSIGTRES